MINKYEDYKTPNDADIDTPDSHGKSPWDYEDYEMTEILNPGRDEAVRAVGESAVNMINAEFTNENNPGMINDPTGETDTVSVHDADATEVGQFHLPGIDDFEQ